MIMNLNDKYFCKHIPTGKIFEDYNYEFFEIFSEGGSKSRKLEVTGVTENGYLESIRDDAHQFKFSRKLKCIDNGINASF